MLLPIGVMILLGMAGTVLYNQLAGMYNDAVRANRDWMQAFTALKTAINQLPDPELAAGWNEKTSDPQKIPGLMLTPTTVPSPLIAPLRAAQDANRRWQEAVSVYELTRQRFPVSVLAKAFKFAPVSLT
ncbi:MAG: hypothetical protein GC205_08045 [Bacteroidetes bacterium]|nr:hypothetical protein [Bacteroidota bacterium]